MLTFCTVSHERLLWVIGRTTSLSTALLLAALAAGVGSRQPWATPLWPWPDCRLIYLFVASILASMAIAVFWIGFLGGVYQPQPAGAPVPWVHAGVLAAFALVNGGLFVLFRKAAPLGGGRMPLPVRVSFAVFALVLLLVGGALVMGVPHVMPWPLQPRSAVLVGWIFIGDALYFALPLLEPLWNNARAPLLSFLVYDLVLLPPLAGHLAVVKPENAASRYVYLGVLAYSAALAVYYLFINPATRGLRG